MNERQERARAVSSSSGSDAIRGGGLASLSMQDKHSREQGARQWAPERESSVAPPAGNTGVLHTGQALSGLGEHDESASSSLAAARGAVLLDYVRATLPAEPQVWQELQGWLGELAERPIGWRGWYDKSAAALDGGLVAWCSSAEMAQVEGILVDLPGRACACLGERLPDFLSWCCERGRVRRCDFALDDRAGLLTYERLRGAVAATELVTRARGVMWQEGAESLTGERTGWTCYVGSRKSAWMVRIYDKRAEQVARGVGDVGEHWVRCELQANDDYADALAREVLSQGIGAVVEQLNAKMRFTVASPVDSNRWRWDVAPWWAELLGSVERGRKLKCGEAQRATIEALREYVRRCAGPAIAAVLAADGGDLSWLFDVAQEGERRWKPRHLAALTAAGVEVGASA